MSEIENTVHDKDFLIDNIFDNVHDVINEAV
jgi:hypothetical protein